MNTTKIVTHQSSDGTLRVWRNGNLTVTHKNLTVKRQEELMASEERRKAMNENIEKQYREV